MIRFKVSSAAGEKISMTVDQGYPVHVNGYCIGNGLKLDTATNTLSVDTADAVEQDNTLPITSAAVHTTVGNIELLLKTI